VRVGVGEWGAVAGRGRKATMTMMAALLWTHTATTTHTRTHTGFVHTAWRAFFSSIEARRFPTPS